MQILKKVVLAVFVFSIFLSPSFAAKQGNSQSGWTKEDDKNLSEIRREMVALNLVQGILDWYNRTRGETSIKAETLIGHEKLFSKKTISFVNRALNAKSDDKKERRALRFLRNSLILGYVDRFAAKYEDEFQNAEGKATISLPWEKTPIPYLQADGLLSKESDPERRRAIQSEVNRVWRDIINPIYEKRESIMQDVCRELGYPSYVAFAEDYRFVNLKELLQKCGNFMKETDSLYKNLLAEQVRETTGLTVEQFRRSDIGRLARNPRFEKFFPPELMVGAFEEFLKGIGLSLKTANGTTILIDDEPYPLKEPRAACYNIRCPGDIRISLKPTGGLDDMTTLFHEGGHAEHFSWTITPYWEFQQSGNNATTEGYAETFSHIWDDPVWLAHYRDYVKKYNEAHSGGTPVPLMSDDDIKALVRHRVFWNLYFIRRYGYAKLIYESVLHGGSPSIYEGIWTGQTKDLQELYREAFEKAYGFKLTIDDALRFRTDVDDFFYSADYTRAYILADMINEYLRKTYGSDWYLNKTVGDFFKKNLWKDGTRLQAEEVAKLIGSDGIDPNIVKARCERLLK